MAPLVSCSRVDGIPCVRSGSELRSGLDSDGSGPPEGGVDGEVALSDGLLGGGAGGWFCCCWFGGLVFGELLGGLLSLAIPRSHIAEDDLVTLG